MTTPTMQDCPKYLACSAPICPLDADWRKRYHASGDRVCFYLAEAQKVDAKAIFDSAGQGELFRAMQRATPAIVAGSATLKRALERAALTGSRMDRPAPSRGR
jgi:hypothetical protein